MDPRSEEEGESSEVHIFHFALLGGGQKYEFLMVWGTIMIIALKKGNGNSRRGEGGKNMDILTNIHTWESWEEGRNSSSISNYISEYTFYCEAGTDGLIGTEYVIILNNCLVLLTSHSSIYSLTPSIFTGIMLL